MVRLCVEDKGVLRGNEKRMTVMLACATLDNDCRVGGGGEEWVELVTDEAWSSTRTGGGGGSTWWRRTVGHRGDCCVRRAQQADPDGHTRWEAPRRRGDALLFSRRSSSTEDSVVVTTLYAFNINLATCPPRQGYATVTSVCCLRLNQV